MSGPTGSAAGFTLVEILIVLTIVTVLALIATVSFGHTSDRAYVAVMQSDLHNIALAQEAYAQKESARSGRSAYAARVEDLELNLSPGVSVRLRAGRDGWSARASHVRLPRTRCALFRGNVRAFAPATDAGRIACE